MSTPPPVMSIWPRNGEGGIRCRSRTYSPPSSDAESTLYSTLYAGRTWPAPAAATRPTTAPRGPSCSSGPTRRTWAGTSHSEVRVVGELLDPAVHHLPDAAAACCGPATTTCSNARSPASGVRSTGIALGSRSRPIPHHAHSELGFTQRVRTATGSQVTGAAADPDRTPPAPAHRRRLSTSSPTAMPDCAGCAPAKAGTTTAALATQPIWCCSTSASSPDPPRPGRAGDVRGRASPQSPAAIARRSIAYLDRKTAALPPADRVQPGHPPRHFGRFLTDLDPALDSLAAARPATPHRALAGQAARRREHQDR